MSAKRSVLVAMSGGVDSSVAACLLAEQGYEVLGSHMNLVHLDGVEHGCCGPRARADADEVARLGGFDFEIVDMSEVFAETVIADFAAEHAAGRTPNPCARCNEQIKFGAFLERADALGIDFVATGHYVRTEMDANERWHLYRGLDRSKDQSYMLHMLGQEELARSLFPVGGMAKSETRRHAERFSLPVASKPDSQEVCFVPGADHAAFVREHVPSLVRDGTVVDPSGRVLAAHDGTFGFTVGQRRGLGVSGSDPSYVLELDAPANRIVVGPRELLARAGLVADRVSWIGGESPAESPFGAEVRIRYRGDDVPATVRATAGERIEVAFDRPQRGVAPGQSVVISRGDEVLGGGRIMRTLAVSASDRADDGRRDTASWAS